ncbi:uncharacterized protein LOC124433630 isoform X3 [Xenia sp. Carnegie-2017]|uniref:uncharacterized protein LOC124433630 isoform X3 n=1 Tax=Xenia sp. Carnegie-2017 TaxID=2897299 RepID=UPI001F03C580|nr:uncharacterized protein LOC124433630 isoform X3 [Xenia sp. Carnegie-2017]
MFTLNDILKPTLLILIAIFVLYSYNHLVVKDLKLCCDNTAENYSHYDLVVGILSSRGNFDLRQSLRESWVGYARRHSSLNKSNPVSDSLKLFAENEMMLTVSWQ